MSYPDVVIASRIEHKVSLEAFRAIEGSVGVVTGRNM